MSSTVSTTAIAAFVGCVVGGVVTAMVASQPGPSQDTPVLSNTSSVIETLEQRMDALEDHNRSLLSAVVSLEAAIESLEIGQQSRAPAAGYATKDDIEMLRRMITASPTPTMPDSGTGPGAASLPQVKEQVAAALNELREQEEQGRRERYVDEMVESFSDWLELSSDQQLSFRNAWVRRSEREKELDAVRGAGTLDQAGLDALAAQHEQAFLTDVSQFLNAEQYQTIQLKFGGGAKASGKGN